VHMPKSDGYQNQAGTVTETRNISRKVKVLGACC